MLVLALACSYTDAPNRGPRDTGSTPTPTDSTAPTSPSTEPGPVAPGELVISELMEDSLAVDGDFGEYFELTSITARDLDLEGLTVIDDDGDGFTITGSLVLPVGGRLVFGPSDNQAVNGGVPVDYPYSIDALKLGNDGDTLAVMRGDVPIDVVSYDKSGWTLVEGASQSLDPAKLDPVLNDEIGSWCPSTSTYGLGDHGTPGAPNDACD